MKQRLLYLVALPLLESARKIALYTMIGAFAFLFIGYLPEGQEYAGVVAQGVLTHAFVIGAGVYAIGGIFVAWLAEGRAKFLISGSAAGSGACMGRGMRSR